MEKSLFTCSLDFQKHFPKRPFCFMILPPIHGVLVLPNQSVTFVLFPLGVFPKERPEASGKDDGAFHKAEKDPQSVGVWRTSPARQNEIPETNASVQECSINTGRRVTR